MYRVLKPGGAYLVVSYGMPPTRMGYLGTKGLSWQVEYKKMLKPQIENGQEVQGNR